MRKLCCPQCKVSTMYVKNDKGERLIVYVNLEGEVIPKDPNASTEGFVIDEVYCMGCSWHGNPRKMVRA